MENKTSRLAMEIADDILEEFSTIRKVIHSAADGDLADIIQRSIDHYHNSQLEEFKKKGWKALTVTSSEIDLSILSDFIARDLVYPLSESKLSNEFKIQAQATEIEKSIKEFLGALEYPFYTVKG